MTLRPATPLTHTKTFDRSRGARFHVRLLPNGTAGVDASSLTPHAAESTVVRLTDADGRVWAYGYSAGGRQCLDVPGTATFVAIGSSGEIVVAPAHDGTDTAIEEIVVRGVAAVFAHRSGLEVLHASAVEFATGVVGFCGAPRSGKSTFAYALARRGHKQWADDLLAVDADVRPAHAVPLPFAPRLRDPSASFFSPAEAPDAVLHRAEPAAPLRLTAVFLLERLPDDKVQVERIAGAHTFTTTLGSSLFFEDAAGERRDLTIRHFLKLAGEVPLFRLTYSSDLRDLDCALDVVEDHVAEAWT